MRAKIDTPEDIAKRTAWVANPSTDGEVETYSRNGNNERRDPPASCPRPCTFYQPAARLDPCDFLAGEVGKMEVV